MSQVATENVFDDHQGFPYPAQNERMQMEAFETEEDATRFATEQALETLTATGINLQA